MSDDLVIGPHGTRADTSELVRAAQRYRVLSTELTGCLAHLAAADRLIGVPGLVAADAPYSAMLAERAIDDATVALARARENADVLSRGLTNVASEFELQERMLARSNQELAALLGYGVGFFLPILSVLALNGAIFFGAAAAAGSLLLPEEARARAFENAREWLGTKAWVLSDPAFVEFVRLGVLSADDVGAGRAGVPLMLARLLGDEGFGVTGVDTSAAFFGAAGAAAGVLTESAVRVHKRSAPDAAPARGALDRIERIPDEPHQVRIDRYQTPGQAPRFEVYIAGTSGAAGQPWDMTSNVRALAGADSGSYRAVLDAMRQAGVEPGSAVVFTGYSQGGMIAAGLAASGQFSTEGLVTVGAPAGQIAVPYTIPYLAIEHTNDLVPALSGSFESSQPVLVRRQLYDGQAPTAGELLPAHQLTNYRDTAGLVDASDDARIAGVLASIDAGSAGTVTSTVFRAVRD
ncbi:hypothetical protein [Cryobacterium sp. BB736]|uniref:hypothetical protein n=1 Tax=Cryobacterium sp. BB736 TaxID=2746963 RepID=UPI001873D47E|nr:hypothetical protein [Cryobacterium sp. BB736]